MLVLTEPEFSNVIMSSETSIVPGTTLSQGPPALTQGSHQDFPHSPLMASSDSGQLQHPGTPCLPQQQQHQPGAHQHHHWDINDSALPVPDIQDCFEMWPSGHCRRVYRGDSDDARRHVSGWAMRNTNNHNALILKKSCLGVLVCTADCMLDSGRKVHLRPAICDKARRKQIGKQCPNPGCSGKLELLSCRGHCGYPVTHFWRHINSSVYFQAKGYHDHPRPEIKSLSDKGRYAFSKQLRQDGGHVISVATKRRFPILTTEDIPDRKLFIPSEDEVMCSCPPFECVCHKSLPTKTFMSPPPYGYIKDSSSHPFIPHRPPSNLTPNIDHPGPFTQINITNTCLPPSSLDVNIPGIEIYKNYSKFEHPNYSHDNELKMFRFGSNEYISNPLPPSQNISRSPGGDFRSPPNMNCPNTSSSQNSNNSSRLYFSSSPVSCMNNRDDFDRYRVNGNQNTCRSPGISTPIGHRSMPGLLVKSEPCDGMFMTNPSPPSDPQRSLIAEPIYGSISSPFHSESGHSPTLTGPHGKFGRLCEDFNKEQASLEEQKEPTYITLTSPQRPNEAMSNQRELHPCRLSHMTSRSPNSVVASMENNNFPHTPQPIRAENVSSSTPPPLTTATFYSRQQGSRDNAVNLSSSESKRSSPAIPRLILGDSDAMNNSGSLRTSNTTVPHVPNLAQIDTQMASFPGNCDTPIPSFPPSSGNYGNGANMPYGYYCNDMFQTSAQAYRNRSINITLTYN